MKYYALSEYGWGISESPGEAIMLLIQNNHEIGTVRLLANVKNLGCMVSMTGDPVEDDEEIIKATIEVYHEQCIRDAAKCARYLK